MRIEHCDIATIETSETSTLCVEARHMSVLATEEMSAVETGQMSQFDYVLQLFAVQIYS